MFQRAFSVSTREPAALLFAPGGHSPTGGVCCMVQRWNVCSVVFWRVVWYCAGTFLCMRSCPCPSWPSWSRRGCGRAVAWPSCPGRRDAPGHGRRDVAVACRGCGVLDVVAVASAVFVSPSCGCDTPTNASVSNGLCGVRVVLVCYLTG